jgi:c-di-GMP-binding flagellar brake protein YcgR
MDDRRRYERVAFFCPLQVTLLPSGPTVPGSSFDISLGGVGLTANIAMERGQSVFVYFQIRGPSHELTEEGVLGRVAYVRSDEDGNRIGVEFLETIRASSSPALARIVDKL